MFVFLILITACSGPKQDKKYLALKLKIESGLEKEQAIRKQLFEKKEFDLELNRQMAALDSINQLYVLEYLENFGYPSISKDGEKLSKGVFYILQHNDLESMEKYIDDLKEKAFEGEASKIHYAMMQDRILTENNQKQIYGTQIVPRKNASGFITSEYYVWPIRDVNLVDSLRRELGFKRTMEAYAEEMGAEFNVAEEIPKG